jgi:DNA helicase-2/ATP-dependent DNA helicase PcrA|tara:strand:- start:6099 stop:8030 length:1932 start_codon:yes stop_codon:yes gene_type:complete
MNRLQELNNHQKEAVLHKNGPLLIIAGAGAGKTRTLAHRVLHLIQEGVNPDQILAVTFTNKAAKEMKERIQDLIKNNRDLNLPISTNHSPYIATFHSLGVKILKDNARTLSIPRHFTIYDRSDSARAVKEATKTVGLDPSQYEPRKILSVISKEKGNVVHAHTYKESASGYFPRIVGNVWEEYEKILSKNKALDFDDLLLKTASLLKDNEDIRKHYQNKWHYIHVDEYQDTNKVQYDLTQLLSGPRNNVCVVGDIDQNIYSWRGARMENLLHFERDYPETKVVILEENYRSTKTIIEASNSIIEKNKNRREKRLFTENDTGEKLSLYGAVDERDEADFIIKNVRELIDKGSSPQDIAVLYRTNFQSRIIEEAFLFANIPYQVLGVRFFERKEIKDVLSFIKAALNPESVNDVTRIINVPARGIGKVTLLKVVQGREHELSPSAKRRVDEFRTILLSIQSAIKEKKPSETIKYILKETGLETKLLHGSEEDKERLENVRELVTFATSYNHMEPLIGIENLLEDAALATDQDDHKKERNAVTLMTVHASKGLEFDYVFVSGLEEGLFPHERIDENVDDEEERRLFYVALTRARTKIFLSFTSFRTIYGSKQVNVPSEFITDIPEEFLESENSTDRNEKVIYLDDV